MFTKMKLFTYLGITIKQCANRSVNYNYINKHYTYADSIYYCSVCIMPQKLVLHVEQTTYIELLMLVLDFVMNHRLENTQWHFCGIHGMS